MLLVFDHPTIQFPCVLGLGNGCLELCLPQWRLLGAHQDTRGSGKESIALEAFGLAPQSADQRISVRLDHGSTRELGSIVHWDSLLNTQQHSLWIEFETAYY